jgi:hypothetical protein
MSLSRHFCDEGKSANVAELRGYLSATALPAEQTIV